MGKPHGVDASPWGGLVQMRSADPNWQMSWVPGPKAERPPQMGSHGRWGEVQAVEAAKTDVDARKAQLEAHSASQARVGWSSAMVKEATKHLLPWDSPTAARFWHRNEL